MSIVAPFEFPSRLSQWIRLAAQQCQLRSLGAPRSPLALDTFGIAATSTVSPFCFVAKLFRSHWSSLVASRSGSVRGKPSDPDTPSPGKDEQIEGVEARRQSQEAAEYTRLARLQIQAYLQGKDEQMEGS